MSPELKGYDTCCDREGGYDTEIRFFTRKLIEEAKRDGGVGGMTPKNLTFVLGNSGKQIKLTPSDWAEGVREINRGINNGLGGIDFCVIMEDGNPCEVVGLGGSKYRVLKNRTMFFGGVTNLRAGNDRRSGEVYINIRSKECLVSDSFSFNSMERIEKFLASAARQRAASLGSS